MTPPFPSRRSSDVCDEISGSVHRVHFADRSFLDAVIKIGRQYRLHIFRGAFIKYEADLRKAPALSVDQTVQPDGSGINQLLNEVQAQPHQGVPHARSEEHTSELQSLMRISYAVYCLKKKKYNKQ